MLDLDALDKLCDAATPGPPWNIGYSENYCYLPFGNCFPCDAWIQVSGSRRQEIAEWIAAARTAVPELIAEVRRLREDANPIRLMERVRRFKRMSRYMATLTWPNVDTFERACGDVLCHGCGLPYFDHPSKDDLHLDCQGRLWKL